MSRWLPFPLVSLSLLAMWLLVNQSLAPGHLLAGALIAIAGGRALARLQPPKAQIKRPVAALRLFVRVVRDILRSNIDVARIILLPRTRQASSGFVQIPLQMRSPYGLAVLAGIITAAPGTCWVDYDSETGLLVIHVLDLVDEQEWVNIIKGRYERLLLEIFE